ncbi:MAG: hypothetical protein WCR52_06325 [Bacteroidota bacterium]
MKNVKSTYRQFSAMLLMLLFTAAWVLQATHDLFLHHKHSHSVCEAAYDQGSNKHFHDHRFAPENPCPLCAVWFSAPELPQIPALHLTPKIASSNSTLRAYIAPEVSRTCNCIYRRGPPALG